MRNILYFAVGSLLLLTGCGPKKDLTVPDPADLRILSLVTAADHILAQLGAADRIVGIDKHGRILSSMQNVPVTVSGGIVSREMLRKYRVNYAVIWYYQADLAEIFRREGIPVMIVPPIRLGSYGSLVMDLGRLAGCETAAVEMKEKFQRTISQIAPFDGEPVMVYMELYAPWKSPGRESFIGDLLHLAGGELAGAAERSGTVSPESVCRAMPEAVIYVENYNDEEQFIKHPALKNTPAVQQRRIYKAARELITEGVAPLDLLEFFKKVISQSKGY